MKKRGRKVREGQLDKFIRERLNATGEDGFTALEKIIDSLIDKAQNTHNYKLVEVLLNRAYGAPKVSGEITHTHTHTQSVPPIAWTDKKPINQLELGFELDDNEKKALGYE